MPDCNIRNIDNSLMKAMRVRSAEEGKTLRDWVIGVMAVAVGWEKGVGVSGEPRKMTESSLQTVVAETVEGPESAEEPRTNDCPDCGEPLFWNVAMRYWNCECGYHGKRER